MKKAFSLLEIIFVLGLFGVLSLLVYSLLLRGMQSSRQLLEDLQQQTEVNTLQSLLASDLKSSDAPGILIQPASVAIVPLQALTSSGQRQWSETLVVYNWSSSVLSRDVLQPAGFDLSAFALGTTGDPQLQPQNVAALIPRLPKTRCLPNITGWSLTTTPQSSTWSAYRLHLVLLHQGQSIAYDRLLW